MNRTKAMVRWSKPCSVRPYAEQQLDKPAVHPNFGYNRQSYEEASRRLMAYRLDKLGRDWTEESYVCYVSIALTLMKVLGCSKDWACRLLSLTGRGYKQILQALNRWIKDSELNYTAPQKRGHGSPKYQLKDVSKRPHKLDSIHHMLVATFMENECEDHGKLLSAGEIQSYLSSLGVSISHRRMCKQLVAWGGNYKKALKRIAVDKEWQEKRVDVIVTRG